MKRVVILVVCLFIFIGMLVVGWLSLATYTRAGTVYLKESQASSQDISRVKIGDRWTTDKLDDIPKVYIQRCPDSPHSFADPFCRQGDFTVSKAQYNQIEVGQWIEVDAITRRVGGVALLFLGVVLLLLFGLALDIVIDTEFIDGVFITMLGLLSLCIIGLLYVNVWLAVRLL